MSLSASSIPIPKQPAKAPNFDSFTQTPGGTCYGVTPGGSKIKYDKDTLLFFKNSPLSKTPPANLPRIPGVTDGALSSSAPTRSPAKEQTVKPADDKKSKKTSKKSPSKAQENEDIFEMEMK